MDSGLFVSVNTDNRTVTGTTVSQELGLLAEQCGLTVEEGKTIMRNAMENAFAEESVKREIGREIAMWEDE